jgi:hypothetical protein
MSLTEVGDFLEMDGKIKKRKIKKKRSHPAAGKRRRGRPGVDRSQVLQTADQLSVMLPGFWPRLVQPLLAAQSPGDVTRAFEAVGLVSTSFVPHWSELILKIIQDRRFPRVRAKAQIAFLTDSLGAQGAVTPRRSREICAEERTKESHFIVRRDYYIECTCGYEGAALKGSCPDCGTMQLAEDLLSADEDSLT